MLQTLKNAWSVPDIRKKVLYTMLILIIFRIGAVAIPVPFLDPAALRSMLSSGQNLLGFVDVMSGGAFANATIFAMSITPYITSSIVIQLLAVAIPALERLSKEGADGRKKLNKITRYTTVALALIQAFAYYILLKNLGAVSYTSGFSGVFSAIVIISMFVAGACLIVWLGEQIDDHGIGNGISMILFAGILSRAPGVIQKMWAYLQLGTKYYFLVPLVAILFIFLIAFIIVMTNAERRVPIQYAKRVVGRKMYGGQNSYIPVKVNMSGVMPVIFASSILSIPGLIQGFVDPDASSIWGKILGALGYNSWIYAILYFLLIILFNYFYVAIQYNPLEMSNNLRKNNGAIPGIRPGKPTTDYISKVIARVTLVGAIFLGIIAVLPIVVGQLTGMSIALGGTSIIIVVGVALDTTRQLESQMMMRHYKGFLE
ncbi:MAG: preprotein translocase subunit SecY [Oscillospiraceae bacterium]